MAKRRRKSTDAPAKLRPYIFHGVDIPVNEVQVTGDCPFCDKPGHFGVKVETGQFRCVKCEEKGNISTFLKKMWEYGKGITSDKDYAQFSEERGVPAEALQAWGVVKSITTGEWLVPMFNKDGKLANLSRYAMIKGEWKLLSTPLQKMHPYGVPQLNKHQKTRWITEGPWDGMVLWWTLQTTRKSGTKYLPCEPNSKSRMGLTHGVLAPPGAGNFNEDWLLHVDGMDQTNIVFDNDHPKKRPSGQVLRPGYDGQQRIVKLMESTDKRSTRVKQAVWGPKGSTKNLPDGYDIKDAYAEYGAKTVAFLTKKLKTVKLGAKVKEASTDAAPVEPIHRDSFAALCEDWHHNLHFTPQLRDTLATMIAVMVSTDIAHEQLWLRVIGPPGSGKSTLAEAVTVAREYVFAKSVFTGMHSGFTGGSREEKKKDSSLIPLINGKTFIVKDGDTLLTAPNRDRILAELRDVYDGTSRAQYRNRKSADYEDIRTTMILCGTDTLRTLNRSSLGERFLDCEILGDEDRSPYLARAAQNTYSAIFASMQPIVDEEVPEDNEASDTGLDLLKRVTYGFLKHLKENFRELPTPTLAPKENDQLIAMAELMSLLRAKKDADADHRPRAELATRLTAQFVKLAVCVGLVLGKDDVDDECLRIVRKVVMDTAEGFQLDIVKALSTFKTGGLSVKQMYFDLRIPETTGRRLCSNMQEFGIIQRNSQPNKSGQRGRDVHVWQFTDEFRITWNLAIGNVKKTAAKPKRATKKRTTKKKPTTRRKKH